MVKMWPCLIHLLLALAVTGNEVGGWAGQSEIVPLPTGQNDTTPSPAPPVLQFGGAARFAADGSDLGSPASHNGRGHDNARRLRQGRRPGQASLNRRSRPSYQDLPATTLSSAGLPVA